LAIVLAGEEVLDGNIMPVLLGSGVIPTELPGRVLNRRNTQIGSQRLHLSDNSIKRESLKSL
jgi:hypothetical protein